MPKSARSELSTSAFGRCFYMSKDNQFKLQINFTNAYAGKDNVAYIEGIASGPEVDLTGERMAPSTLKSMVEVLKKLLIEFRDVHQDEWTSDIDKVVEFSLKEDNQRRD